MAKSFYVRNAWWLFTGAVFMFGSSFGQTYFIALFAGAIRAEFGLSNGQWGGIYTVATLASATCLIHFGRLADTMTVTRLAAGVLVLYALSATTMALAPNIVVLCLAVFGLRFCGQGMMTHISMTAMARWFRANRAKAIAVAVLGFPISEALWPPLGVVVLDVMGWRETWLVIAGLILAVFLPALTLMTRKGRTPQGEGDNTEAPGMLGRQWTRGEVLRHWTFWTILPGLLAPPFIGTCVFFHQVHIATVRGYDLSVMALGFAMYAGISVASSLACGPIVDRIGPARVLPVLLLPLAVAIAILAIPAGVEIWFLTLAGIGISHGLVITLIGAIWPTLYGTRWIGSIKALATSGAVMSTAAGPGLTGAIIDMGVPFPEQALFLSAYCLAMTALFTAVAPKINAMLVAPRSAVPA
ncbi:MFS transporter [Acuticoccus sp. I52.16.1]|uniref:MFS transporter n=1 Tax=Acuticoccus sp. I52.16.1 TaxID=2928472 RepID=UPI001FD3802E|nr:MFS transporter [Acuticoccus sp. I52.16.1]UOM34802.1 MFS transporter [Acuticoccus sp. I52.16.1]